MMNVRITSQCTRFLICLSLFLSTKAGWSQTIIPDIGDTSNWFLTKPNLTTIEQNTLTINASEDVNGGMVVFKKQDFMNGTITLEIKGADKPGRSFVGLAFNIQSPEIYEAVYLRPFNFHNADRKSHASQYIYMPAYPWRRLRSTFPGKFENEILNAPDPDEWFQVRLVFRDENVKVFVGDNKMASLVVDRLALNEPGKVGFWVGSNTKGSFRNLIIQSEDPSNYGYNSAAGKYFSVEPNVRLYYEEYGQGDPILMLHGGVYGYIDEYAPFIWKLSQTNRVICLATRGHVKSDIGYNDFTYDQRADDARKLLDHLMIDKAQVIGFSDGGFSAYRMAASFPDRVKKLVVIGAGNRVANDDSNSNYNAKELMAGSKEYFTKRVAEMPEPDRWDESLQMLNKLYDQSTVSSETFTKIKCPTLILIGDHDQVASPKDVLEAHNSIESSTMAVIPNCGHVVFHCNWPAVWACVEPFLGNK